MQWRRFGSGGRHGRQRLRAESGALLRTVRVASSGDGKGSTTTDKDNDNGQGSTTTTRTTGSMPVGSTWAAAHSASARM